MGTNWGATWCRATRRFMTSSNHGVHRRAIHPALPPLLYLR
ncbi:MAG TPA: hypothetical protein VHZ51_26235 [Ktedonobacteraceae bacterium]|nr:hypothetical protein [Ktedonobacteraceae bacterium]